MARRRRSNYTLHNGKIGKCPECGKSTGVQHCSLAHKPKLAMWTASSDLLAGLFGALVRTTEDGSIENRILVKETDPDTGKVSKYRKWETIAGKMCRCGRCSRFIKKHAYFVVLDAQLGEQSEQLMGPLCSTCLGSNTQRFENADGVMNDFPVYKLPATIKDIAALLEFVEVENALPCEIGATDEPDDLSLPMVADSADDEALLF